MLTVLNSPEITKANLIKVISTSVIPDWLQEVTASYASSVWVQDLLTQLSINPTNKPGYTFE